MQAVSLLKYCLFLLSFGYWWSRVGTYLQLLRKSHQIYFDETVEIYSLLLETFPDANVLNYVGQEADVKMMQWTKLVHIMIRMISCCNNSKGSDNRYDYDCEQAFTYSKTNFFKIRTKSGRSCTIVIVCFSSGVPVPIGSLVVQYQGTEDIWKTEWIPRLGCCLQMAQHHSRLL